jgi:hypothetical protein
MCISSWTLQNWILCVQGFQYLYLNDADYATLDAMAKKAGSGVCV